MNVQNAFAMLFICIILFTIMGVGNIVTTYEAVEQEQISGTTGFILIAGLIFAMLLLIRTILAKINSWRNNKNE